MAKLPEIPDLLLPTAPASSRAPASGPRPQPSAAPQPVLNDDDDLFGGGIERGMTAGPSSGGPSGVYGGGKSIAVDFGGGGGGDDDFSDSLERGAGSMSSSSMAPPVSRAPISSRAPASLDVAYRRTDARPAQSYEPATWEKIAARVVPVLGFAAAFAPLVMKIHHAGAYSIMKLAPHAFDATSTTLSGIASGVMLVASIAVGFLALRRRDRSYAMVVSAGLFLLLCLAMVTVTLVSTDEAPQPPDGARLVPYLVPAAVLLLGLGTMGRGVAPFFRGGARRALSFALGVLGGLIAYAGLALSTL